MWASSTWTQDEKQKGNNVKYMYVLFFLLYPKRQNTNSLFSSVALLLHYFPLSLTQSCLLVACYWQNPKLSNVGCREMCHFMQRDRKLFQLNQKKKVILRLMWFSFVTKPKYQRRELGKKCGGEPFLHKSRGSN